MNRESRSWQWNSWKRSRPSELGVAGGDKGPLVPGSKAVSNLRPLELGNSPKSRSRPHAYSLRVLDETGIEFMLPEAWDVLEANGARVDRETGMVRLDGDVVEHWTPRRLRLSSQGAKRGEGRAARRTAYCLRLCRQCAERARYRTRPSSRRPGQLSGAAQDQPHADLARTFRVTPWSPSTRCQQPAPGLLPGSADPERQAVSHLFHWQDPDRRRFRDGLHRAWDRPRGVDLGTRLPTSTSIRP